MRFALAFVTLYVMFTACSPVSKSRLTKEFKFFEKKFQDHTGFVLYDLKEKKEVYNFNADKYFTPASNTKIFTLFTSLKIIGDSIPGLKFIVRSDSLIFWGTGDPSLLYKNVFNNNRTYNFLRSCPYKLYFSASNFQSKHFGRGWAWDDYNDSYSAERSSFPIYGNIISILENRNALTISPPSFKCLLTREKPVEKSAIQRSLISNELKYSPGLVVKNKEWSIPFRVDPLLITKLLSDTLKRPVTLIEKNIPPNTSTIYSLPADSLYKVMMQDSDNFIAEQLLLICSGILSDTLQTEIAIIHAKKSFLSDLPQKPLWIDGSGLSRYNLFTPQSIVTLWQNIYNLVPQERLFKILAIGGESSTMKNFYKSQQPYIFGKTGTLSNNHNMSGYLITKKGKVLIFAFMNNNYVSPLNDIRKNMESILKTIQEHY